MVRSHGVAPLARRYSLSSWSSGDLLGLPFLGSACPRSWGLPDPCLTSLLLSLLAPVSSRCFFSAGSFFGTLFLFLVSPLLPALSSFLSPAWTSCVCGVSCGFLVAGYLFPRSCGLACPSHILVDVGVSWGFVVLVFLPSFPVFQCPQLLFCY
jgi:hypothetical protein